MIAIGAFRGLKGRGARIRGAESSLGGTSPTYVAFDSMAHPTRFERVTFAFGGQVNHKRGFLTARFGLERLRLSCSGYVCALSRWSRPIILISCLPLAGVDASNLVAGC